MVAFSIHHVPDLRPDEYVNRISYAPEHVKNGQVMPEAVSITDLETRGFSLDRDFVPRAVIEDRVRRQIEKKPLDRQEVKVSRFTVTEAQALRGALPNNPEDIGPCLEEQLLTIEASPVPADPLIDPPQLENLAHCHILVRRKRSRSVLKKIRHDFILPVLQRLLSVDEFFAQRIP